MGLLAGCAHDDPRLQGTWHSNRDATVAAAFQRDPRWTNAPPEKVERFTNMFGNLSITFSNNVETSSYHGVIESFPYRVVRRGSDYLIIRSEAPFEKGRDIRIQFVEGANAYWIDTGPFGFGLKERFDKVSDGFR